jgi:hypothetical protein
MANTLAYHDAATIAAVKVLIARLFATSNHFHPSLIFAGKPGAYYLSGVP